ADCNRLRSLTIVRPERRVTPAEYDAPADFDAVSEINLVPGRDDTAITQNENGIDWIDDLGIRDRVDLVHPDYLAVSSQSYFRTAANHVQVSDARMVFDVEFFDACDDVE